MHRLVGIMVFFSAVLADARMMPPPVLNPKDYESPSGEFVVNVDPSDMYGRGPGSYRVTRNGVVIWSGQKPFTLYEAEITDKGTIAGYAYTHGIEGFARERGAGPGEFHIVIMRPDGELILDETIERTPSRFLHTYPNPVAITIKVDGLKNQFVIVVADTDVNRRQDVHWAYQLSSGRLLSKSTSGPNIPPKRHAPEPDDVPFPEFPTRTLDHIQTFMLVTNEAVPAIRDIVAFDVDNRGRIGFIRRDSRELEAFILTSPQGEILSELALPLVGELARYGSPKIAWITGERWVMAASGVGVGAKASAWWFDAASRRFESIATFNCPAISCIAGSRDGGFVALATKRLQYSMENNLIAFDKAGKSRWEIKEDHKGDDSSLFSPEDVTVTTSGRVAVIDVIRGRVQLFSTNGNFLTAINLERSWKRKPNYPSGISADKDDGFLIEDFHGSPPVVRMNAQGQAVAQFFLKHPDGRIIDLAGGLKVDFSGAMWASDGQALIRLRDDGVSDFVLGAAPSTENLGKIAALTLDHQGRIYAMDDRTGAVHVYETNGTRLRVCKPDISDFTNRIWNAQVVVAQDGAIFTRADTTRFVQFGPDGRRVGTKKLDLDTVSQQWYALPNGQHTLVVGYHEAYIVDPNGQVIREIQRRPNRHWLEQPRDASVAPDGSLAIITGGGYTGGKPWQVHLYTSGGDPIRSIDMPNVCMSSFFAYSGKLLVTRTDKDLCVFAVSGEPLSRSPVALTDFADVNQRWQCFIASGGQELWVTSARRKSVSRFQLPSML